MTTTYIIPTITFEKLKQKAKKLKKEKSIPHHEALDIVANDYGKVSPESRLKHQAIQSIFQWKHIVEAHTVTKLAEDAISDGFVVLIDPKDDPHCDTEYFIRDVQLECLCEPMIKELYLQRTDPEEDGHIPDQEELLRWFHDEYDMFGFFRLKGRIPNSKKKAWELYFKEFFFAPEAIIFKGEAFNAFDEF